MNITPFLGCVRIRQGLFVTQPCAHWSLVLSDGEPWIDFREGQPVLLKLLADVLHCTPSVEMVIINAPMSSPLVSRTFASRMKCSVGWPANLPGNDKPFVFVRAGVFFREAFSFFFIFSVCFLSFFLNLPGLQFPAECDYESDGRAGSSAPCGDKHGHSKGLPPLPVHQH